MNQSHRYAVLLAGILPACAAFAEPRASRIETTETTTAAQVAKQWGLTESDWQRYQEVQAGPRGTWSPGLDPLTSLGLSAETDAERKRYAELLVQAEKKRVEQELAFQQAYDQAWKRLYPDLLPVQSNSVGADHSGPVQASRLVVFVSVSCATCKQAINKLLTQGMPFDLFVVGTGHDDQVIRDWAKDADIPPERVRARTITLNHDTGQWLDLGGLTGTFPAAFKHVGEKEWLRIDL